MIDAVTFATSYNAFWQSNAPMSEHYIRRLNLDGMSRFDYPMDDSDTTDRAYIAEYAFSLFVARCQADGKKLRLIDADKLAKKETDRRLRAYESQGLKLPTSFSDSQRSEIREISVRLERFFRSEDKELFLRPKFSGCGFVDASEGDVIFNTTLYEVKTVDRRLRGNDLRQLITYSALNFSSAEFEIEKIGIINPRRGLYFEESLDLVCSEISGKPAKQLLLSIIDALSMGDLSR